MAARFRSRTILTLCVCFALLIKATRVLAQQDDFVGYRHEFYREDGDRMSIDTDTANFDVGFKSLASTSDPRAAFLADHLRLAGSFVEDAISGSTPTGSPPVGQWPQATFKGLYPAAYGGPNGTYNTLLSTYTDPNNNNSPLYQAFAAGLIPGVTTLQQFTNWVAKTGYQQYGPTGNSLAHDAGVNATNAVKSQLAAQAAQIASNPAFRNPNVPLTHLSDRRMAYSFAPSFLWDTQQLTPQYAYSREHDYHSYGSALNYSAAFNKKNTVLNAGYAHTVDRVLDVQDGGMWVGKVSDDFLLGVNQLISPKSYFTANLTYGQEYGYLNDQYREVMFDSPPQGNFSAGSTGSLAGESRPRRRTKEIIFLGYQHFFDAADGSVDFGYRFFHDSYGVYANTGDLAWHQKLGRFVVFTPALRYYRQTAATFYYILVPADQNGKPAVPNYSSDYRLSELDSWTMSADFTFWVQKHVSLDLAYMRYIMHGLDGVTSQSAYPSANVYSIGARLWF